MTRLFQRQHCWSSYRQWLEEMGRKFTDEWADTFIMDSTCILDTNHSCPHVWTKDDKIVISIPPLETTKAPKGLC